MSSRTSATPSPAPDEQPVPFERGSGRHRADTMPIQVVSGARAVGEPAQPSPAAPQDPAQEGDA